MTATVAATVMARMDGDNAVDGPDVVGQATTDAVL